VADIFGDWREELIIRNTTDDALNIYSTVSSTDYRVPTLMHDHTYRMAVAWQNASYNQPPHLSYSLAESLGIDRVNYQTNVVSTAPEATPSQPATSGQETLKTPTEDKAIVTGTCYTAGTNGELTASTKNDYLKVRTGNNNNTITFNVNEGYAITGITVEGWSNNTSTTADRSITMTGIFIDGSETSVLTSPVVFPGGTAGQNPVTSTTDGFRALQNIVLAFDNSKIVTSEEDSAGKNKQIFVKVTFTYEQVADGIKTVHTVIIDSTGAWYDLRGQRVDKPQHGVFIHNGKKVIVR
jgi:rhamnogalacturonan endolyase